MTVETKAILHINQQIETVAPTQMAIDAILDPELGFRAWGGRDAQGQATRWAALRKAASFTTLRLTGATTSGSGKGVLQHDSLGNITGGPLTADTLPDHNELDAIQGGTAGERYHLTAQQVVDVGNAILKDGSRAFTGTVAGITPTDPSHLVTKSYVDAISADWDFLEPAISLWDASAGLPVGPTAGDRYVCSVAGNGWALNSVYEWSGSAWVQTIPHTGNAIVIGSGASTAMYVFTGTTWKSVGSTTVAPADEIITGTGTGYTSSSTAKINTTALVLDGKRFETNTNITGYVGGPVASVTRHNITRAGEFDPPDSYFEEIIGEDINSAATAWIMDHIFTNAVADGHAASVEYDLYPFTRTRQGIIVGATTDPLRHLQTLAGSTIAQIILVYDGAVGQEFRGIYNMGPANHTGKMGVFDRNIGPGGPTTPVYDWAFEVEHADLEPFSTPVSFTETYASQLITGGLNISGGRAPGIAANSFRRDTYLYPEYLVNGQQPAHTKHGVDAANDRTLAWNYTWDWATKTLSIPAGAHVWFWGTRYSVGPTSIVLESGAPATGKYRISFSRNETTGVVSLQATLTPFNIFTMIPVATIYVNNERPAGAAAMVADERHNCFRSLDWHTFSHWALGTRIRLDGGFSAGDYVINSDLLTARQPVIATGFVLDEDVIHSLPASTKGVYSTAWLHGADGRLAWNDTRTVPIEIGAGDLATYNQYTGGAWVLTPLATGYYSCIYEMITMRDDLTTARLWAIGQAQYSTEAGAIGENWSGRVEGDFSAVESVVIRKWIIRSLASYATPGKFRFTRVVDLINTTAGSGSSAIPPHNGLTGRDVDGAHPISAILGTTTGRIPVMGTTGLVEYVGLQYTDTVGLIIRGSGGIEIQDNAGANAINLYTAGGDAYIVPASGHNARIGNGTGTPNLQVDGAILEGGTLLSSKYAAISHTHTGAAFGSQTANTVLAAPNGTAGDPTFRALVAADIPNLAASKITSGTFAVARGGTGLSTIAAFAMLYASATDTITTLAPNTTTTKKYLTMTGTGSAGAAPVWDTITIPSHTHYTTDVYTSGNPGQGAWFDGSSLLRATGAITFNTTRGLIDTMQFDLGYTQDVHAEGRIFWDNHNHLPAANMAATGVILNIGAETYWGGGLVKNISGTAIPNGAVVICTGSSGGLSTVALANASTDAGARVVGVATCAIANNSTGYVTGYGIVRGLNTSSWAVGDVLYLAAASGGSITNVAPNASNYAIKVGRVVSSHATQGEIQVSIGPAWADVATFNELRANNLQAIGEDALRVYNYGNPAAGTTTLTNYEMWNAANARTVYAKAGAEIVDNTASSEDGAYVVKAIVGGVMTEQFRSTGGITTFSSSGPNTIVKAKNTTNTSQTILLAENSVGKVIGLYQFGTGVASTGTTFADGSLLYSDGSGGLTIATEHVSAPIRFWQNGGIKMIISGGSVTITGAFGCNGKTAQTSYSVGSAASAGGTGTAAGGYDTAAHRDALITLVNNMRLALIANGIAV